jgi:hemolysin III
LGDGATKALADAAVWMDRLANQSGQPALAGRLHELIRICFLARPLVLDAARVMIALRPMLHAVPLGGLWLLLAGGLCYTGGTVFYAWKKLPYHHAVWHLWVLAGSACHWAAVFCYIVPTRA